MGGLLFTAVAIRKDTKSRRIGNLLNLSEQHRELWREAKRDESLRRIFDSKADASVDPLTFEEEQFLNLAVVHFATGWALAKEGSLVSMEALRRDVKGFFNLPLPYQFWRQSRNSREPGFAGFVDSVLKI